MLHATSVLRYPVFLETSNYKGSPKVRKNKFLQKYVRDYFADEVKHLRNALYIPLGSSVSETLTWLTAEGANNERISYLIGKKPRGALSNKTNATILDDARTSIKAKVEALGAM
jgi:hypothetical protein